MALPSDGQKMLIATSQQAMMDQTSRMGIYHGNVVANQGSTALLANQVEIKLDLQNALESAIATGAPAHFSTIPHINDNLLIGTASRIEYYPQKNQVLLIGNALVTHNQDTYNAQTIYYNTLTQAVYSPKQLGQRVTMVLQPRPTQKPLP